MSPSPASDPAPKTEAPVISSRRWRRLRARARLMRIRMHSHPVLLWTWRVVVIVVACVLFTAGVIMWFTPGPGWGAVFLGLLVLATEFGWARSLLRRGQDYALRLKAAADRRRESRGERK